MHSHTIYDLQYSKLPWAQDKAGSLAIPVVLQMQHFTNIKGLKSNDEEKINVMNIPISHLTQTDEFHVCKNSLLVW